MSRKHTHVFICRVRHTIQLLSHYITSFNPHSSYPITTVYAVSGWKSCQYLTVRWCFIVYTDDILLDPHKHTVKEAFIDEENDSQKKWHAKTYGSAAEIQNPKQLFCLILIPEIHIYEFNKHSCYLITSHSITGQKAHGIPISTKAQKTQLMAGTTYTCSTQFQPTFLYHLPCTGSELYLTPLNCTVKVL